MCLQRPLPQLPIKVIKVNYIPPFPFHSPKILMACPPLRAMIDHTFFASANNNIKSSIRSGDSWTPCLPLLATSLVNSFINSENKTGEQISPCFNPRWFKHSFIFIH